MMAGCKQVTSLLIIALIIFQVRIVTAQSLRQRSNLAFSRLESAGGTERVEILNELALCRLGDTIGRALYYSREAVRLSEAIGDQHSMAASYVTIGRCFYFNNNPDSCSAYMTKALDLSRQMQDRTNMALIFQYYGRTANHLDDADRALMCFDTAVYYATLDSNRMMEGRIYNDIADCYKKLNNPDRVESFLERSYDCYKTSGDSLDKAAYLMALGVSYGDLGKVDKANEMYLMAIRCAEKAGDSLMLGYAYSNLASICYENTFKENVVEYNLEALNIFKGIGNERGMAYSLNNLGQYYFEEQNYDQSIVYYKEAGILKEKAKDWQGAGFVHCNLAELYIMEDNYIQASKELSRASELEALLDDDLLKTVVSFSYGKYYSALNEPKTARDHYFFSLKMAEKMNLYEYITKNLSAISDQYIAEGNPDEALSFYKRYSNIKDSVSRSINQMNLAELQLKYETEKKDTLLRELMASEKNRSIILGNIIIALFLVIGFLVMFFRLNNSKRTKLIPNFIPIARQTATPAPILSDHAAKPVLHPDQQEEIWHELSSIMDTQKLYMNRKLKMSQLASLLNTNTSYLSKVINEVTQDNFCNYLNQLRIREARKMLADPANHHLTIEAIAQSVGFNSKSAFNTAFKKFSSVTPSEFMTTLNNRN